MEREQILEIAKTVVLAKKWPWQEPIHIQKIRPFLFFGPITWYIMTNANTRGGNVNIRISDKTGAVLSAEIAPR